jgi:hypothetical protein
VTSSATLREPGAQASFPAGKIGPPPPNVPASASRATTSSSGGSDAVTNPPSAQSRGKAASPSTDRLSKKATQRAKSSIAVLIENIFGQLDKMETIDRMRSLLELSRRINRRLDTEAEKIAEDLA